MQKSAATRRLEKLLADSINNGIQVQAERDGYARSVSRLQTELEAQKSAHNLTTGMLNGVQIKLNRALRSLDGEAEFRQSIGNFKAAARLNEDIADLNRA